MPSFDVVSEIDLQEIDNAVNQTAKEIGQRFDFRGGKSSVELDKGQSLIKIIADDEFKLRSIHQVLEQKVIKRGVDMRCLQYEPEEPMSGGLLRQTVKLKAGLDRDEAKEVVRIVKDSKLKVVAEIQEKQVRISGKKIDDLQAVMATLRGQQLKYPLQYINMRS